MALVQNCNPPCYQENDIDHWLMQHPRGVCIDEVLDWIDGPEAFSTNKYAELKSWNLKETVTSWKEDGPCAKYSQQGTCNSTSDDENYTVTGMPGHICINNKSKLPDISWFCERYNEEVEISKNEENLIPHTVTEKMLLEEDSNLSSSSSSSSLAYSSLSSSSSDQICSPFKDTLILPTSQATISTYDKITMQTSASSSSSISSHENVSWMQEDFTSSSTSSLSSDSSLPPITAAKIRGHLMPSSKDINQRRFQESCTRNKEVGKAKSKLTQKTRKPRAKRGRIPGQRSNTKHLCDFMKTLLDDPSTNPSLVRWEDEPSRVFSIIQSKMVAQMWGTFKNNSKMNYENFGRAMRYCRKVGDFDNVPDRFKAKKKKLIFKFGPRAT
ncbi:hypothetical protein FSP39_005874 [Pinctada imbricata]|uniref:ETS domain-containing protein n=1 Tax=Pinctada imbricata TaxID=66713 RepID=A0AA88YB48_PINIB|nr:hypothetical protein FSP39_005874 [Pinctada imbricata]